jgi:hypothetical protein
LVFFAFRLVAELIFPVGWQAITEEDKAFANVKRELREEIRQMRRKVNVQ